MVYINSSTSGTDSTRSRCNSKIFMCISVNTACHNGMYLHHCALCSLSPNTHMHTDSGNNAGMTELIGLQTADIWTVHCQTNVLSLWLLRVNSHRKHKIHRDKLIHGGGNIYDTLCGGHSAALHSTEVTDKLKRVTELWWQPLHPLRSRGNSCTKRLTVPLCEAPSLQRELNRVKVI